MSDTPIQKMDFKQLRNEVQLLRDELAKMRRQYEDLFFNLDNENFSSRIIKEKEGMKAEIKLTAEEIKTKVSETDIDEKLENYSTISQTAEAISLSVTQINEATDAKLKNYSTIIQTAEAITNTVTKEYVDSLIGDIYVSNAELTSEIEQSATEIKSTVSATYETKAEAENEYENLYDEISTVSQTAGAITSRVSNLETFKESVFTQTAYGFTLDGEQTTFTGVIYLTDNTGDKSFSFFLDDSQGYEQVFMHNCDGQISRPLVIGDKNGTTHNVYIGSVGTDNKVATQGWVENNAEIVAVFG